MDLVTFGMLGEVAALVALLVAILFLAFRSRLNPRYTAAVVLLGLALGGAFAALATETIVCPGTGDCVVSDAYRPKAHLLWALAAALLIALVRAPWRRA